LAFGAAVISGFSVFINSYGVRAVPDATVYTTTKNLVAAFVLIGFALLLSLRKTTRPGRVRLPRSPKQLASLVAIAIIGGSVPFVLFFEGLARASSGHAAFIQKTLVVWVALLAVPLLGEKIKTRHLLAIGLLVGGLLILENGLSGFAVGSGELLVFLATLLWAGEVVLVKRLLRDVVPSTVAVARMGLGVVALLGWVAVSGRWSSMVALDANGWRWALLTGVILATYVATWFTSLSLAPAIDVTAILVVGAVITSLLSAVVKGTPIPGLNAAGLVLVTAAAVLVAAARVTRAEPSVVSR
jgi:drug/metabolite transporter (DMT)-like permease